MVKGKNVVKYGKGKNVIIGGPSPHIIFSILLLLCACAHMHFLMASLTDQSCEFHLSMKSKLFVMQCKKYYVIII